VLAVDDERRDVPHEVDPRDDVPLGTEACAAVPPTYAVSALFNPS
jgi:hypothetical protein